ncbi:MAG: hypothetical protein PSY14_11730 [bacterium]|nr:hypothetical protein [bacterium]
MQTLKALTGLFTPAAAETQSEKLARHIDGLKKRENFFVFDGTLDTPAAKTARFWWMAELVGREPTSVFSVTLDRLNSRRPEGGDRIVMEGVDKVKRLYVMYDIRETDNFPALAPALRAVLADAAEYKGGYGFKGQQKGELDLRPLNDPKPATGATP